MHLLLSEYRNKDKVIMNDQCGYLMRTKVSSSNEGGVAAGFAVLDSIYLNWQGKISFILFQFDLTVVDMNVGHASAS